MRRGSAAAAVVAAGALVAACGSSPAHPAPSAVGPADEITAATVGSLGTVLVDGQGYTLYAYAPDAHGGRSRCTGVCPAVWPPVTLAPGTAAPIAGPGVDRALLATTIRPGGGVQVTYGGWPLYRWTGDSAPGAHTGQDIFNAGGYWYVVRPDGHVVR
ncbi:MAG: hypothetical protein M0Z63_07530 [Actinomycetota bacterium]|nr:hypothetical protein [Actinomycetota bacterium]